MGDFMAEFCSDCWNDFYCTKLAYENFILTRRQSLCEGCGKYKRLVITTVKYRWQYKLRYIFIPLRQIYRRFRPLFDFFGFPYRLIKYRKEIFSTKKKR